MNKLTLLVSILVLSISTMNAQGLSIGVVDTEKIASNLSEFKEIEKEINDLSQMYRDSLINMQTAIQQKAADLQKQMSMMPQAQQQQAQAELQQEYAMIQQFQQEKFGQQGEVMKRQAELVEPIRQRILEIIEDVANANKINLVLDKAETPAGSAVLFASKKIDITFKVLDKLTKE